MASITDNDPAIQQAFEQLDRFYADPELRELDRQRRLAIFDQMAANAAKAEGKAGTIVRQLTKRFGAVPSSVEEKLYSISDIDKLDRLADSVIDCQSLQDFENGLV